MKIDGKQLAQVILNDLKKQVSHRKKRPVLAVIQVGDDEGSTAYINQKRKKSQEVGIEVQHTHFPVTAEHEQVAAEIQQLNSDNQVTGIIIQRPLPASIDPKTLIAHISPRKDVDGFREDSPYTPPVARGVLHILSSLKSLNSPKFPTSLINKKIVILGRGETAGHPIAQTFEKLGIPFQTLHSRSSIENPVLTQEYLRNADIIISCVGKSRVIKPEDIKIGVILIGVGISRGFKGLQGDYDENEIKDIASYYTPTPGGVGPLTVAFLLSNTVQAAKS